MEALKANTGSNNTAVGYRALYSYVSGPGENVAIGIEALFSQTAGYENIAVGRGAGNNTTTGVRNTYIGDQAGSFNTTASNNTIIGRFNGNQGGVDTRTSSNSVVISDGDGNPRIYVDSAGKSYFNQGTSRYTGHAGVVSSTLTAGQQSFTAVNQANSGTRYFHYFLVGDPEVNVGGITTNGSSTSFNTSSDHRLKENVDYTWDATTRLKQLKPARFNFIADADTTVDGFLAHEAQAVVPEAVHGTHNEVDDDGNAVMQGIDQSKLVPLLVKTIQELEARITALEGA